MQARNKLVEGNVILTTGEVINIDHVIEYYITQNHSKIDTAKYFNLTFYQMTAVIVTAHIVKDNKLSRKLNNITLKNRYGDEHYNNLEKAKRTCLERYGVDNIFKDTDYIKQSYIKKFGVDNPNKLSEIKEKVNKTNFEKYGVKRACCLPSFKEKVKETSLKKYGVEHPMQSPEVKAKYNFKEIGNKAFATKKLHNTTNSSSPQKNFIFELKNIFGEDDILTEYNNDSRYPFHCDVYIKSLDMFIELNLFFTHGKHSFDENNEEDVKLLQKWKEKAINSKFYQNAIDVWTIRDPLKKLTAEQNNINYIMIYSINELNDFINKLKEVYNNEN